MEPEIIKVHLLSVDGFSKSRRFKTLAGAQKFAQHYVGDAPELGGGYAISWDGVCRITTNIPLKKLFPKAY
jgi:hypothetical protein